MVPIISAIYCITCGVLGLVNAEKSKGNFWSGLGGIVVSAFGGFVGSVYVLTIFLRNEPAWMIWLLYVTVTVVAAVAHGLGFFLCCVMHAAGNDVSA